MSIDFFHWEGRVPASLAVIVKAEPRGQCQLVGHTHEVTGWPGKEKGGAVTQAGADHFLGQGEYASAPRETYQNLP